MKRTTFLALLATLVLTSPLAVFAAEHDYAKWEKDIARFEKSDATNPPQKGALLFIGSSTIVRWKTLATDYPGHKIINRGFGGNMICDSTHFAERMIFPYEPKMIFLRAGGNDINAGKTPEEVFQDFKDFVAKMRTKLPEAEIVYISMSPSVARVKNMDREKAANELIQKFIHENKHLQYADTWPMTQDAAGQPRPELFVADNLHFNEEGYKLLAERVRPFLPK